MCRRMRFTILMIAASLMEFAHADSLLANEKSTDEVAIEAAWREFRNYLNDVADHRELSKVSEYIHPKLFEQIDRSFESLAETDPSLTRADLQTAIALDIGWRMQWILEHEVSLKDDYACIGLIFREYGELRHGLVMLTKYSGRWVIEDSFINVRPQNTWEFKNSDVPHACHQAEWQS